MNKITALSDDKKMRLIFRLEGGCLGPQGAEHIVPFCKFAQQQQQLQTSYSQWVSVKFLPRTDLSLAELEYQLFNKTLPHNFAEKYLKSFDKNINDFEQEINDKLLLIIEQYWNQ